MDPFYFADRDGPLFGMYRAPEGPHIRDAAVLLCSPIGHEQIVSHRAFTQLTRRLAAAGFAVMRFDYFGCGDSAGACEEGAPARWRRDIDAAIGSLRLRSACRTVAIAGCRFGATLAAIAGAERQDIASMALWDPVVSGAAYLDELTRRHAQMLQHTHVAAGVETVAHGREFLGMALGAAAIAEIERIDLLALAQPPAPRVLIVDTGGADSPSALRHRFAALGSEAACERLTVENAWTWIEDVNRVLVPQRVVAAIVSWLSAVHA